MRRPCIECGEPTSSTRCPECKPPENQLTAAQRGYGNAWTRLSRRARKLQPWCTDCGTTENLTLDHLPSAWTRKAAGKTIRLGIDAEVVCAPCNQARGPARGPSARRLDTRAGAPPQGPARPLEKAQTPLQSATRRDHGEQCGDPHERPADEVRPRLPSPGPPPRLVVRDVAVGGFESPGGRREVPLVIGKSAHVLDPLTQELVMPGPNGAVFCSVFAQESPESNQSLDRRPGQKCDGGEQCQHPGSMP